YYVRTRLPRSTPFLVRIEPHTVLFLRDGLPHHVRVHQPVPPRATEQAALQLLAHTAAIPAFVAAGTESRRPAAEEIRFLPLHIPEVGDITTSGRIPAIGAILEQAVILGTDARRIIVEAYEFAHQPVVVPQPLGKPVGDRVEQDEVGIQRRCVHKNDLGMEVDFLQRIRIDDLHACSPTGFFIVQYRMGYRVWPECKVARFLCPGYGGCVTAEIAAERAPTLAQFPVLALHPALLDVDGPGLRQVCAPGADDVPAFKMAVYRIPEMVFYRIQRISGEEFPIRQGCQSVFVACNTYKPLHMAVPRCNIGRPDWPIHRKAVAGRPFEIIFGPPLCLPCPQQ